MTPGAAGGGRQTSPLQEDEQPLSGMRKTIAQRMSQAKREVPHFYLEQDVDMEQIASLVGDLTDEGREVSFNDFILMGAARALCEVPRMNAAYREDHVKLHGQVNLGFAVAVEDGLYTPVIRQAEQQSLDQIRAQSRQLIQRALEGELMPDEYQGGTFTVSNLGMFNITNFAAVINPPESGILAVGTVREEPVVEDGNLTVGKRMAVTLAGDHRVIDGAIGARYLQTFARFVEQPYRLLT
jgi:pyruvate dehydrogenase E2 component (dihydrolipoamide acetyltransferase)